MATTHAPGSLSWLDIERDRRSRGLDAPDTVFDGNWARALGWAARLRDEKRRAWALAWVAYCSAPYSTIDRPAAPAFNRDLVLKLAGFGIIDPEGFDYGREHRVAAPRKHRGAARGVDAAGAFRDADGNWIAPF